MQKSHPDQTTKWLYLFIGCAILLNFSGLFVTIMGPDAALYASIAKQMVLNHNYVELFVQGKDWLDKPHFPFWITALFFEAFGVSTWVYKLPGILSVLLAAGYTYKLAKVCYNEKIALWSALILLTAQHILICTMDVRAEPFLTGLIIAAVYHFYRALNPKWFLQLLAASAFAACAVMTKGIFALIPIGGAIATELLVKKDWVRVFSFRWIIAIILILIFILPELYSLYLQFDLHPEKVVFGHQHVSGIRFFFWDSQFGRFFNNGPIKKSSGDPAFFLHTILWAYLPWSLVLYTAIYQFFRQHFRKPAGAEWLCIGGSLLTLLVFSLSKFQLPFYITIVFPFFSILCAQYLYGLKQESSIRGIRVTQYLVSGLMVTAICLLHFFFRPPVNTILTVIILVIPFLLGVLLSRSGLPSRVGVLLQCCCCVFFVNLYFNLAYYPQLLKYQADSEAAFWINTHNPRKLPSVQTRTGFGFPFEFYVSTPVYFLDTAGITPLPAKPYLLYADQSLVAQYLKQGIRLKRLKTFEDYRITRLKGRFLNSGTRKETLSSTVVVLVY